MHDTSKIVELFEPCLERLYESIPYCNLSETFRRKGILWVVADADVRFSSVGNN